MLAAKLCLSLYMRGLDTGSMAKLTAVVAVTVEAVSADRSDQIWMGRLLPLSFQSSNRNLAFALTTGKYD